jgi:hypothetical protein
MSQGARLSLVIPVPGEMGGAFLQVASWLEERHKFRV